MYLTLWLCCYLTLFHVYVWVAYKEYPKKRCSTMNKLISKIFIACRYWYMSFYLVQIYSVFEEQMPNVGHHILHFSKLEEKRNVTSVILDVRFLLHPNRALVPRRLLQLFLKKFPLNTFVRVYYNSIAMCAFILMTLLRKLFENGKTFINH